MGRFARLNNQREMNQDWVEMKALLFVMFTASINGVKELCIAFFFHSWHREVGDQQGLWKCGSSRLHQ